MSIFKTYQNKTGQLFIVCLMLALMPAFQGLMSVVLFLLILNVAYSILTKKAINPFSSQLLRWSLMLSVIYILGSIGSRHPDRTSFEVIQKSSVALMGILLIAGNLNHPGLQFQAKRIFILSNILALLYCLLFGAYKVLQTGEYEYLFYTKLSVFLHPGYFAMYLSLCFAFLIDDLKRKEKLLGYSSLNWIALIIIAVGIYLLASKSGILTALAIILIFAIRAVKHSVDLRKSLLVAALSFAALIITFSLIPSKSNRIRTIFSDFTSVKEKKDYQLNTTGQRILIWRAASEVIENNFWIGTGVGNENFEMDRIFEREGQNFLLEKKPNAHNQFLQVFMALGVSGFLFFCAYLLIPVYYSIKRKDIILLSFAVIVILNALTESTFNRQAGILFWAVWAFILIDGNEALTDSNKKS
ncbi:MAG: O-antigen ligase family protein [Bacteroidia bacterium]